MIRLPKSALAALAGIVLVFAAACGSSTITPVPPPGGTNAPAGTSTAPAVATVNPQDPSSIITGVINGTTDVKSFHIKLTVNGTIKAAALADAGSAAGGLKGDIKLDGTAIEGDVDIANQAGKLTFNVPPLAALGNVPLTGDLIVVSNTLYYKVTLLGPKYTKMDLGSIGDSLGALSSSLPVAVPSAGASAAIADQISQMRQALKDAGVTVTLVGVDKIGGKDASHINVSVPLDKLNSAIAAEASAGPAITIDSASVDIWVYTDSSRLAQVELKGASSTLGNLDITLTISNYDQPVTVTAPSADQVNPTTP
ncbi:MAG: LppX_LprAFG lipoprotein [Candidatus Limnocylindrales bacterium]